MNKKTIILTANIAAIWIFFYLLGAFAQGSFDIAKWEEGARLFVAVLVGMCVYFLIVLTPNSNKGGSDD